MVSIGAGPFRGHDSLLTNIFWTPGVGDASGHEQEGDPLAAMERRSRVFMMFHLTHDVVHGYAESVPEECVENELN